MQFSAARELNAAFEEANTQTPARAGEILVTRDAIDRLPEGHPFTLSDQYFEISGLRFEACLIAAC